MLERLRPASSKTDHLFIGTDRYQYFTVSWDAGRKQLRTEQSFVDQADKVLRDSRESDRCHIDPSRRYMTLELYDGIVTVVPIIHTRRKSSSTRRESAPMGGEAGTLGDPMQVRIEELTTRSSGFVQTAPGSKEKPRLALLWEDNLDTPQLKIRELTYIPGAAGDPPSVDMKTVAELRGDLDLGVSHLIPVSAPYGGFLILGERSISYVDNELANIISQDLEEDATIWTTWEKVDEERWLLADDYGRLYFLMVIVTESSNTIDSWRLDQIGTTSKASALVYLDEGFAFIGSHTGDSQVIQIKERGVAVVQTLDNIAPILDFTIMDLGRGAEGGQANEFSSGQARIVTASGAWQDGSIRSVRSGVGIEDLGTIGELSHITDLWAINSSGMTETEDTLIVTFVDETRIFKFDPQASVEEVDSFCGLNFSEATLLVANLSDRKILQVCGSAALVADLESGMTISQWKPPDGNVKITAACASSEHLLLVVGGITLQVLDIANQLNPVSSKVFSPASEIASITIPPSPTNVCIISFFQSASVAVLDLSTLTTVYEQSLGEPGAALPRYVLVANVISSCSPTLFIAMADGSVVTFPFDSQKNVLGSMNRIILGSEPVFFKLLPRDMDSGLSNVFASCEQPSLIYASEGRIIYSAVNSDKASRVCHFNSEAYPRSIAIATPTELKLAMIDTERTTQLETLSVGETVRCLSYSPTQQIFGMGCIRRILESGAEGLLSSVKIADEINFKELDSYELNDGELIECIISTGAFKADDEDASPFNEMFIIGTSLLELSGTGDDTTKGRIIVFQVNKDKKLKRVTELGVKGACRSLAMCEGKLVAGLVKTVSPNCTSEIKIVFRDTDLSCILGCFICPHSIHHTRSAYH
jgi:DNA damage-binding protein 1